MRNKAIRRGYGLEYAGRDKIYDGKIHLIVLWYSIDKGMQYEDARRLFYELVDGLLNEINSKPHLCKFFYDFPVGYKDLHIILSFDYADKIFLKMGEVKRISIYENEISYNIVNKDGGKTELKNRQISPDVYLLTGYSSDTRKITRQLPEKDR